MRYPTVATMVLVACGALGASSCGSDTSPSGPVSSCNITLSGAKTGTYACAALGAWTSSTDWGGFELSLSNIDPVIIHANISFPGDLHPGTFAPSDTTVTGGVTLQQAGSVFLWGAVTGVTAQCIFTLTVDSTGSPVTAGNGDKSYGSVHGTLDATAPAFTGTGASGTITMHAVF